MPHHYPKLDLTVLRNADLARRLATENADYFGPECPYEPAVVALLRATVTSPASVAMQVYPPLDPPDEEAEELLKHLKSLKDSLPKDTNDQLAWVRAAATLLDKIVTVKERAQSVKRMAEFEKLVLDTLQDQMTPQQRTQFQDRMANANLS